MKVIVALYISFFVGKVPTSLRVSDSMMKKFNECPQGLALTRLF
jgi:hypothetical protein